MIDVNNKEYEDHRIGKHVDIRVDGSNGIKLKTISGIKKNLELEEILAKYDVKAIGEVRAIPEEHYHVTFE